MRIAVLGSAVVGQTLAAGLARKGHEVRIGSRSPAKLAEFSASSGVPAGTFDEIAAEAEVIVLAVHGAAAREALESAGRAHLAGKVVIDTTNPIEDAPPEDGVLRFFTSPNRSWMEELQAAFPEARFVKAFSCVGSAFMVDPVLPGGPPTMFYCGNDPAAKEVVAGVLRQLGWDCADMGTAKAARAIEPLCQLWCLPGFRENRWSHAFKLLQA